jgi:hypothetical protein
MITRAPRQVLVLVLMLGATLGLAGLTAGPSFAANSASLYVVQGLPGRSVDVSIGGKKVASGVKTAAVVGPFKVAPGSREVTFSDAGTTLLSRKFAVKARSSWDVVDHLPAGGSKDPTVTVFRNDTSSVPRGKAELVVAHTATVPAADVRVNGKVLFSNIANGQSLKLTVPVATYKVAITPTGKKSPVYLGPVSLTVKGGAVNRVYALGDPDNNTMNVAVHVLTTGSSGSERPKKVDTGTGGEAAGAVRFLAKLTR